METLGCGCRLEWDEDSSPLAGCWLFHCQRHAVVVSAPIPTPKSASQSWDDLIAENMKALKALEDAKKAAQPPLAPSGGGWAYYVGEGAGKVRRPQAPDISQQDTQEMPALEIVELCSAKPPCGLPDEECGQCRAKNCPGVKCWRGCNASR
jgi:hypothetical protein